MIPTKQLAVKQSECTQSGWTYIYARMICQIYVFSLANVCNVIFRKSISSRNVLIIIVTNYFLNGYFLLRSCFISMENSTKYIHTQWILYYFFLFKQTEKLQQIKQLNFICAIAHGQKAELSNSLHICQKIKTSLADDIIAS